MSVDRNRGGRRAEPWDPPTFVGWTDRERRHRGPNEVEHKKGSRVLWKLDFKNEVRYYWYEIIGDMMPTSDPSNMWN